MVWLRPLQRGARLIVDAIFGPNFEYLLVLSDMLLYCY